MITTLELEEALMPFLPVSGGSCQLALPYGGPRVLDQDGALHVVLQLIVFDDIGGQRQVRDIKEQQVCFVTAVARGEPERVRGWVAGWAAAVGEVLESAAPGTFDTWMPADLVDLTPLKLAKAETAEDFRVALLKKGRLGRWLP